MADPLLKERIVNFDIYRMNWNLLPCCSDQYLKLKFIPVSLQRKRIDFFQRIQSETGLCIWQLLSSFDKEPEVGKAIGQTVAFGHVGMIHRTSSNQK